ncbi:MAG: glycosyltransferase, partial [Actinomycetota bacterium]
MSDSDLQMEAPLRALYLITSPVSARFLRGQLAFMRRHGVRCVVGTGAGDGEFDDGVESFDVGFSREIRLVRDLMSLAKTVRLIRRLRPDIVNASTPKAGLVGTLAAAACRVERRVYVVRGLRYETARGTRRRVLAGLERLTMRLAHVVVFNSPSLLERARADGVCRPSTGIVLGAGSGNGIDTRRFSQLVPGDEARRRLGLENVAG